VFAPLYPVDAYMLYEAFDDAKKMKAIQTLIQVKIKK